MDDASYVRRLKCIGNLGLPGPTASDFQRLVTDEVLQSYSIEELHHHEGAAIFFADVVNGANVWMVER